MEDTDDSISMIPKGDKKPYRMKNANRLFHNNLTFHSAVDTNQVNMTHRETEHRQMSVKLTIVTLLILVSTLVFLVLFLMVPIFYNLNHPVPSDAMSHDSHHAEETLERGHSHSSSGSEKHADHDDGMNKPEEPDAHEMLNMASEKMNSEWIRQISEICPCFAKLVKDGKSESALNVTTATPADVEVCLRSCFSDAPTTAKQPSQRIPTPGPPEMQQKQEQNNSSGQTT